MPQNGPEPFAFETGEQVVQVAGERSWLLDEEKTVASYKYTYEEPSKGGD